MRAGPLRYWLTLLRPNYVTDSLGSERVEYSEERTVHAERVRASGRTAEEAGEHFPAFDAEYNIRDAHPCGEDWRVQEIGGYLYTVAAIVPNIGKGYKTLKCRRVNE